MRRLSSEPAFTACRSGSAFRSPPPPWQSSATLSSNCLMLPGLTRTPAQPAFSAAKTYSGWKWMSAMTGMPDFLAIAGRASASSWLGTATRTTWQPEAVSSAIVKGGVDVGGQGGGHRLDGDGRVATHVDLADLDLAGLAARREGGRGQGGKPQIDAHGSIRCGGRGDASSGTICRGSESPGGQGLVPALGTPPWVVPVVGWSGPRKPDRVDDVGEDQHDAGDQDEAADRVGQRQHRRVSK